MLAAVLIALVMLSALAAPAEATFPGRNGDLLVTEQGRSHSDTSSTLFRIDPRSGALTRTTICAENPFEDVPQQQCFWAGPPAVSPDGRSVAFAAQDVGSGGPYTPSVTASLRLLSLDTGAWTQVSLGVRQLPYEAAVRWAPDRSFLVPTDRGHATLFAGDGVDMGTVLADGSEPDVSIGGWPAFVRRGNVWAPGPNGRAHRLTAKGGVQPSWSPHGRSIAFARKGWVYTVRVTGGRPRRLTRGFQPTWSPDGRLIAFFRAGPFPDDPRDKVTYLYVLNRSTGRVRRVSSQMMALEGANDYATNGIDWQPAG